MQCCDLSYTDTAIIKKYSVFGPKPRTPSCMQRSYMLSIDFEITSETEWFSHLKTKPLFAILNGFDTDDTPILILNMAEPFTLL